MEIKDKKKFNEIVRDVSYTMATSFFNTAAKYDKELDLDSINAIHQGAIVAFADCMVRYYSEVVAKANPKGSIVGYVNNVQKDFAFTAMKLHSTYKNNPITDGFVSPKKGDLS